MKSKFRNSMPMMLIIMVLIVGGMSCKSNKKLADVSDKNTTKKEQMNQTEKTTEEPEATEGDNKANTGESSLDLKTKTKYKLADYFAAVSSAPSVESANRSIQEALNLFYSPDALVLIIINESNGKKDFDRPTTIKEYLNYLKDQKKNLNNIDSFKMNDSGKITELELKRK